jgi:hypothetical protein
MENKTKKIVKCPHCGTNNQINTDKHKFREKRCTKCLQVIDNESPKKRVLSVFQIKKVEARKRSRERFINKMLAKKMSWKDIEKRLNKRFDGEE